MFKEVSFQRLHVFCGVVECQGFRAASERLNISQPSISAHIRALEAELGVVLVERSRITRVTEAGAILYDFAKQTLKTADEISLRIKELRNAVGGRITVAVGTTLSRTIMHLIYSQFKKENPGVEMILKIGSSSQICQMILNREVDFGYTFGDVVLPGIIARTVAKDEVIFVAGPRHPLAQKENISPAELSEYQFVLPSPESVSRIIQRVLAPSGITINQILMVLEDAESIRRVVSSGMGLTVQLKTGVAEDLRNGNLVRLSLNCGPIYDELKIIQRSDKYPSPIQAKFIKFCQKAINEITNASE